MTANNKSAQGGKAFGHLKAQQEMRLCEINKEFLSDEKYEDIEDLEEKLQNCKKKFMEFDLNDEGEIDIMGLKMMMEKLGVPKTHLEMKKMITEVAGERKDAIDYRSFICMLFGPRSSILKIIMMFEEKANEVAAKPLGPPPKRDIRSLP